MQIRIEQLHEVIDRFGIERSSELIALGQGRIDSAVASALVSQYYPVNLEFPLFLAAGISLVSDEPTRQLLVQNLWEEHGSGDPKSSHTELFRKFAMGVDLDPTCYEQASPDSPAAQLIAEYNRACRGGPTWKALAFLFSFEKLFGPLSTLVAEGFRCAKNPVVSAQALAFFDVHGVADIEHAQKLQEALLTSVVTPDEWREALKSVELGAKLLTNLFVAVARSYGGEMVA